MYIIFGYVWLPCSHFYFNMELITGISIFEVELVFVTGV